MCFATSASRSSSFWVAFDVFLITVSNVARPGRDRRLKVTSRLAAVATVWKCVSQQRLQVFPLSGWLSMSLHCSMICGSPRAQLLPGTGRNHQYHPNFATAASIDVFGCAVATAAGSPSAKLTASRFLLPFRKNDTTERNDSADFSSKPACFL